MTRKLQNKSVCPKCGTEVETVTPFSQWLRELPAPLDSKSVDNQNLDYIWFHYRTGWFVTIEEKRFGAQSRKNQSDTHQIVAQMLALASGSTVKTMKGDRRIVYRGHYVVSFEKTTPDDSAWVNINGAQYTDPKEAIHHLLTEGSPPRQVTHFKEQVFLWVKSLKSDEFAKFANWVNSMKSSAS